MTIDPLQELPGYLLQRVSAAAMARLAGRLAEIDLRPTEASALMVIAANDQIIQNEVGRVLGIVSANMTPLASRLEDRGLLSREPLDGRSYGLRLTASGEALVRKVKRIFVAHEEDLLSRLRDNLRPGFVAALQSLWKAQQASEAGSADRGRSLSG